MLSREASDGCVLNLVSGKGTCWIDNVHYMDNSLDGFCRKWYTYIKFVQTIREKMRIERSSDG